jgi:hypothetical protein
MYMYGTAGACYVSGLAAATTEGKRFKSLACLYYEEGYGKQIEGDIEKELLKCGWWEKVG